MSLCIIKGLRSLCQSFCSELVLDGVKSNKFYYYSIENNLSTNGGIVMWVVAPNQRLNNSLNCCWENGVVSLFPKIKVETVV